MRSKRNTPRETAPLPFSAGPLLFDAQARDVHAKHEKEDTRVLKLIVYIGFPAIIALIMASFIGIASADAQLPPAVDDPTPQGLRTDELPPAVANPTPKGLQTEDLPDALHGKQHDSDCPEGSCSRQGPIHGDPIR